MPIHTVSRLVARVAGKLPLRTVLIIPFVVQIVGTVGLVGYLSYRNGQDAVNDVASRLHRETSDRVQLYLKTYLATPHLINRINVDAVRVGQLDLQDDAKLERYLVLQLQQFDSVDSIIFGSNRGKLIAAYRLSEKALLLVSDRSDTSKISVYASDSLGNRSKLQEIFRQPDVRERPWYKAAASAGKPTWTQIFQLGDKSDLTINANRPIYEVASNKLLGVFSINLELTKISKFLQSFQVGKSGKIFILERNGLLIANSGKDKPYIVSPKKEFKRLKATESSNTLISATSRYLTEHFGSEFNRINNSEQLDFKLDGKRQFVQVMPFRDEFGLDWLIVVVVPESDFMEQINAHTRTTIGLCVAALFGSIAIGILNARWITKPILRLNSAVKDIAKGDWDKTVDINRADEVGELANSFNRMAAQLQQSFTELNSLNAALAQRESQLKQFLEALPVGVSIHDTTGKVTYFNPTAKRLLGIETIPDAAPEELTAGYQLYRQNQLYPTEQLSPLRALKGETVFIDDMEIHRDGKIFSFEVHATPIFGEQGNINYAIVVVTDISERKQAQKVLADYHRNLETEVAQKTEQRKQAEQALEASQARFAGILDIASDAIITIDASQRITLFNEGAEKIFGYTSDEVLGQPLDLLLPTRLRESHRQHITAFAESVGKARKMGQRSEIFARRKDGTEFPAEASISKLEINGEKIFTAILRDISDRKRTEDILRESEERFRRAFDDAAIGMALVTTDGYWLQVNRSLCELVGYTEQELLSSTFQDITHPEDLETDLNYARQLLVGEIRSYHMEKRYFHKQGHVVWILLSGSLVRDTKGNPLYFIAQIQDISDAYRQATQRKQAEQALRESEERFQEIARTVSQFFFVRSASSDQFLYVSPAYEKIWGRTCESLYQNPQSWIEALHPDDREIVLNSLKEQLQGNSVKREYRIIRPDGSIRWIFAEVSVVHDDAGQPLRFIGIAKDISDRQLAEEALRQSEATNRAIVSAIPDLLIWMDRDGTYLEIAVGRDFKLFNSEQSYVGTNIYNVLPDAIAQQRMEYVQLALQTGELQVYEHQLVVEGEIRYEETRIAASEDGKVLVIVRDITDRKRTEETLREREEQLQLALEGSGDGFWDWNIPRGEVYYSPRYIEMLGYEIDEFLQEFSTWDRLIHPDDKPWVMATLNAHLADSSVPYNFDYRLLTKSGEWKWIANYGKVAARDPNGAPLRMTGTHRDVSDKKLAEQQLLWKEALLRSMTEASPLAFYVVDNRTDAILYFNHRFCDIWGIEHLEERMHQGIVTNNDIIPECIPMLKDVVAFAESCKPLQSEDNRIVVEDEILFVDGRTIRRFSAQIRDRSDRYFGRLYIFEDITERKQSQAALQQAKETAETANFAKSVFLASMSHELRTPLNAILGYAQILQRDKNATSKQKEGVDIIYQCGIHLLTLINDILDLSKIEAGKLELYPEDFNFRSFLTDTTEIFRLKAIQKSLTFTYLPLGKLPAIIHADEKRLRQVLMNLLSNAVKFTDRGGVTFKVGLVTDDVTDDLTDGLQVDPETMPFTNNSSATSVAKTSNLTISNDNLSVVKIRFQVEDTGIGITAEQLAKIFLPFEQVGDTSRRAEGTGLGLAITQKIVELMGGKVFVESTPNVGSRFLFDLDVPVVSMLLDPTPVKTTDTIIGYCGEKRKILIVDDRWENRAVLVNILEPIGFELEEAADGQEGLEKAVEFQPDLILADLVMPVMDGYEMTQGLRQLPEFLDTIIIAISANAFGVDRQKTLEAGYNDFLPKPVQSEDLLNKIQSYLNLSWIYESESETQSPELGDESSRYSQVTLTEMVIPPKEELLALYEAAITGYVQGVKQELIRLQQLKPDYSPFASRILELADDFEYEEIINFIDPYLS